MNSNFQNESYFRIDKEKDILLIIRKISDDIIEKINIENKENKIFHIIFDIDDLSKKITIEKKRTIVNIYHIFENIKRDNLNIYFKNCLIEKPKNSEDKYNILTYDDEQLLVNKLYISDELCIMSPYLNLIFQNIFPKELYIKNIKINSKLQLTNFFLFITKNYECEKLLLEDINIELIIKNNNDNNYNELSQYFYYSKGEIKIKNFEGNNNIKIKQLKLIDAPLFVITKDIFINLGKNIEIYIDIDNNSILNPGIITKFKIKDGLLDICFDLDSYKINLDKDYLENL